MCFYISQLVLNLQNRKVQKDIANPYDLHRQIMMAFPDRLRPGQERVLFRLEPTPRYSGAVLLVQSWGKPNWSPLVERDTYFQPLSSPNPHTKQIEPTFVMGELLRFRLRANPTACRGGDARAARRGKRMGLYREEEQRQWFERQAVTGGFRVQMVQISLRTKVEAHDGDGHKLVFAAGMFDGVLKVRDPEQFAGCLKQGIGSGKGFGFGLLTVARMSG